MKTDQHASPAPSALERRTLLAGMAALTLPTAAWAQGPTPVADRDPQQVSSTTNDAPRTVTLERRDQVLLIGINRPAVENRIDPPTFTALGRALFEYENDASLRAAVLFGHGDHFCAGLDVVAFAPVIAAGTFDPNAPGTINPLQVAAPRLSKPLVSVTHGNTFFLGHELLLASDVRVAARNAVFSQGEPQRAVFAGGGATIRFTREAGWGQAMRYMLTGDTWTAEDARRMSLVSEIAPTPAAALELGLDLASKIARAAPLSIKATLASAHQAIDEGEDKAFRALGPTFGRLTGTEDFQERVRSLRENRLPAYQGR